MQRLINRLAILVLGLAAARCGSTPAAQPETEHADHAAALQSGGAVTSLLVPGLCLDVVGAAPVSGAPVQLARCNGTAAQQWVLRSGALQVFGTMCLDVGGQNDGAPAQISSCS